MNDSSVAEDKKAEGSVYVTEDEVEIFSKEEVGLCGQVGYWRESTWKSQMVNA